MPRPSKPWFRRQTGWWMAQIAGKQVKLAQGKKNKSQAQQKLHELLLVQATFPESPHVTVASLAEAFLEWSHRHHAADTYRGYLFYIQSFCDQQGRLPVRDLRPFHVSRWVDNHRWNDTSRYNALKSVFRVLNWATQEGLIAKSPLAGMKRPRPLSRQRFLTDDEYRALLRGTDGCFRRFLFAMRQTGARPSEMRRLTWDQVHDDRWILNEHKTVRKTGKARVIYLTAPMVKLVDLLRKRSRSTHVFVNARGKPWTTNAVRLRVARLRKKLSLRKDVCAYLLRHSFGTHAVLNGVDLATVAELMGHVDTKMVSTVYVHLAEQTDHLKAAVQKAVTTLAPNGRRQGA